MNFVVVADKSDLLREINISLMRIPSSKLNFEAKGAKVRLQKLRVKEISMSSSVVDATLAAIVFVDKDTLLTKVSAEGEIEIKGQLKYNISEDWQLDSDFKYISHNWLENPDVNIGLIQFSVKSLIDNVIEKQKENIEETIDNQLKAFSDLSVYMNKILPFVNQTIKFQMSQLHILPNISEIIIDKIIDSNEEIKMTCSLVTESAFILSSKEKTQATLPSILIRQLA